ncbi:MAG: Ig-like domain-containing protein [Verrucomicrobiia bacterium]|jgi:plastocyanin
MNVIQNLFKVTLLSAEVAIFGCSLSGFAATANVLIGSGGFVFTPATTNIAVNDRVIWTWAGNNHSTTSDTNGLWDSLVNNSPHSFTNTFTSAGTFPYHCTIHVNLGMKGTIIVAAANLPPTVSITNPASGTVFAAPANVTIQAAAADGEGTVTNVQFLVGANVVTNKATAPFSAVTNNLAAGSYTLFAIASDNSGATATNAVTISVVTPVTVLLGATQPVPPTMFRFSYTANTGLSYIVQRSTNLASPNWTTLVTNLAGNGSINFTDQNATFNPGFYRVGRMPNP